MHVVQPRPKCSVNERRTDATGSKSQQHCYGDVLTLYTHSCVCRETKKDKNKVIGVDSIHICSS